MEIFTLTNCSYCDKLKGMLDADGYEYTTLNLEEPDVEEKFKKISKITGNDKVPTVLVGKSILSPGLSFTTIDECYKIILTFI